MLRRIAVLGAIAATAAAAGAVVPTGAIAADKLNLRYSQWLPPAHWTQRPLLHKWYKEVAAATDGRVNIQPTAKGLGAPPRQYQLARDGIADVVWVVHGYTPGSFPLSEMVELPFITRSGEANSVAYWRVFKKVLEPAGMHKEVHTLTMFVHVPGQVYNNKRPINALADFKGLKLRIPNAIGPAALKALGAVPMSAPVTKPRDGLAKGVFDGTTLTDEAIYAFKIAKFTKYATHIPGGLYNVSFSMAMNKAKWQKIAAKDQATVMKLAGEALSLRIGRGWDEREAWAPTKLKEDGVVWNTLEGKALAGLKEKLKHYEARWIEKADKAGIDGAKTLAMYRAEVAGYGG